MNTKLQEKRIHLTFEISVFLKGVQAFFEIIAGFIFLMTSKVTILSLVSAITNDELSEDSKDLLSQFLLKTANDLSVSGQHFVSFYLLSHGIIKMIIVVGLFKKKLWAYPSSISVFTLFILYQLYRYTYTHSVWLLIFSVLDLFIILLTLHEYRSVKLRRVLGL